MACGDESGGRGSKTWCPFGVLHADGGRDKSFRVWADHGFCFAEKRYFTVTRLLAAFWEVTRAEAAAVALGRIGYVAPDYASLWEDAVREPEPDRDALAAALAEWCRSRCPDWLSRQYEPGTAARLARCLGLLPLVRTGPDCARWLEGCQQAMAPYLTGPPPA